MSTALIEVKNPHSILATLEARPDAIASLSISSFDSRDDEGSASVWRKVADLGRKHGISAASAQKQAGRDSRDFKRTKPNDGRVGHSFAMIRPKESLPVEKLIRPTDSNAHRIWIALDCIQDPHNLGAIFRTASFLGIAGVVMTLERSSPLTGASYDVSSGGIEALPFSIVPNLKQAIEKAKDAGLWVLGTSEHAQQSLESIDRDRSWLVVFGNEEKGLRRLTLESCDVTCKVPRFGKVDSLNVSVAAGIVLSHLKF